MCIRDRPSPTQAAASWCTPAQIERARQRMQRRNPGGASNGRLSAAALRQTGAIEAAALELWEQLINQRGLSTRSSLQLLRVGAHHCRSQRPGQRRSKRRGGSELLQLHRSAQAAWCSVVASTLVGRIPVGLGSDRRGLEMAVVERTQGMGHRFTEPLEPCLLYTSPSPRDQRGSRMPSSA